MVLLHIKLTRITKCSNMVANILPPDPLPTPLRKGSQVKIQLFQIMVMLHIKYFGTTKCSNMVANILPTDPPPLTLGVKRSKFNLFRTMSCCISNQRESQMQQHGSKHFACRPPYLPPLRKGPHVKIQLFQNIVMLHIKFTGITKCSNMLANILPADPLPHYPRGWRQKVKIQLFQNNVMLHIKLKGITNAAIW